MEAFWWDYGRPVRWITRLVDWWGTAGPGMDTSSPDDHGVTRRLT